MTQKSESGNGARSWLWGLGARFWGTSLGVKGPDRFRIPDSRGPDPPGNTTPLLRIYPQKSRLFFFDISRDGVWLEKASLVSSCQILTSSYHLFDH